MNSLGLMTLFADLPEEELKKLGENARAVLLEATQEIDLNTSPTSFYVVSSDEIWLLRKGLTEPTIRLRHGSVITAPELLSSLYTEVIAIACAASAVIEVSWATVDSLSINAQLLRGRIREEMSQNLLRLHIKCAEIFKGLDEDEVSLVAANTEVVSYERGDIVMHQGGAPDYLYIVVSGALQIFRANSDQTVIPEPIALLREGTCVGEMAVLLEETRSASVRAHRDSVLLRVSATCFKQVLHSNADLTLRLARTLSERLKRTTISSTSKIPAKTIALIPYCETKVFDDLCRRLSIAIEETGDKVFLRRASLAEIGNWKAQSRADEAAFDYILYQCDRRTPESDVSEWTRQSLRQADLILCVGLLGAKLPREMPEELKLARRNGARVELTLLRERGEDARGTAAWLDIGVFHAHHHLTLDNTEDINRLVRRLTGRAWGLVLSGGGARGFAHIGVVRALQEYGIPIDMIAGTSMGAILAAQYAMNPDPIQMLALTRKAYVTKTSWSDYTFPLVSLHTGSGTMARLREIFGNIQIEDLAIPYFCVSCNLTRAAPVVHERGSVALWARVSCSVPGLLPPMPWKGDLLVDGGLLNNLPTGAMKERLGGSVIAADVSIAVDLQVDDGLTTETSWSAVSQIVRKFTKRPRLPTIMNLLMRSAEVSSVRDSRIAGHPAEIYLDLPVSEYAMTDFEKIDRIVETGYEYTMRRLKDMKK